MEDFFNSGIGKIIRWIFVLPISFLSAIIIEFLVHSYVFMDPMAYTTMGIIFNAIIIGGVPALAFVYSGATVAPHFKRFVSIFLSIIIIFSILISLLYEGAQAYVDDGIFGILLSWENILKMVSAMAGAIIATISVFDES